MNGNNTPLNRDIVTGSKALLKMIHSLDILIRLIYQPVVVGVVDSVDVVVDVVDSVVGVVDSVEVEVVVVVVVGHASSAQLVVSSACDPSASQ